MKIGIFGGSFDPIHCGHAMVANYVSQLGELDCVWLMPSPQNPIKQNVVADFWHRLNMCRIVSSKCNAVEVSDFENNLPAPHYTYETLCALRDSFPQDEFKLIIGSDNWETFRKWKNPDKIIDEFGLIVYMRPGFKVDGQLPENVTLINDAPVAFISSTLIRKMLKSNMNLDYLIDSDVIRYIKDNKLYKNGK